MLSSGFPWSRGETKGRRSVVRTQVRLGGVVNSGCCLICDAATSRRLSEEAYQRSATKRHPDTNCRLQNVRRDQSCYRRWPAERLQGRNFACSTVETQIGGRPLQSDSSGRSLRSVMMGGRNEVTAGGGGRKTGGGGALERIAAVGDSPGDI